MGPERQSLPNPTVEALPQVSPNRWRSPKTIWGFSVLTGVALAASLFGVARASSGKETGKFGAEISATGSARNLDSDIIGPQDQMVCAFPKDVATCDVEATRKIGEGMQGYAGDAQNGEDGLSFRLATKGGKISVTSIQLNATSQELIEKAEISVQNPTGQNNMQDFMENETHRLVGEDPKLESPQIHYAVLITGVPSLGSDRGHGVSCGAGTLWAGMDTINRNPRTGGNRNVVVRYLTNNCNKGPFKSFTSGAVGMVSLTINNEGFLQPCHEGFTARGRSTKPGDVLKPDSNTFWWQSHIGKEYLYSKESCRGLDVNPRMAWKVNASTTRGKGAIKYFSGGQEIKLDPGERAQAGKTIKALYQAIKGEKFNGWSGDCSEQGKPECEFLVDELIDIQANVTPATTTRPRPKVKFELVADAGKNGKFKLGRMVGSTMLYSTAKNHIEYSTTKRGERVTLKIVPNKGYRLYGYAGCEFGVPSRTNICGKVMNNKNPAPYQNRKYDYARVSFTKIVPKPEK